VSGVIIHVATLSNKTIGDKGHDGMQLKSWNAPAYPETMQGAAFIRGRNIFGQKNLATVG